MESANILCDEKKDRISDLPINVIDCVFKGISVHDAARTVILSRNWRNIWPSYPQLIFDENFVTETFMKHRRCTPLEFTKLIDNILSVHSGPVLKFILHVPKFGKDLSPEIDQWMLYLSRNGIKDVDVDNPNSIPYIMPSCILLCSSLIKMRLHNCILKSPHTFGGFRYLVKLYLKKVSFSANTSATLLHNALVLRELVIMYCTGLKQRRICAPLLDYVCMADNDNFDWRWFKKSKQLRILKLKLRKERNNVARTIDMIKFFKNYRRVKTLWLEGVSLEYQAAQNPSESLATRRLPRPPAPFLRMVRLCYFEVDDLDQISSAFCLLKSSPNLKTLEIDVAKSTEDVDVPEPITRYLDPSNCMDLGLGKLRTVKMRSFKGRKVELLFIKLLLARSTCLERMIIEQSKSKENGASGDGVKIFRELLQFTRASSRAEIHVLPR